MIAALDALLRQTPAQKVPVQQKVIRSGRMIEVWEYQFPSMGTNGSTHSGESEATEEEKEEWRKYNKRQAFHNLLRLFPVPCTVA